MRRVASVSVTGTLVGAVCALSLSPPLAAPATVATSAGATNEVIIEFDGPPAADALAAEGSLGMRMAASRDRLADLRDQRASVLRDAAARGLDVIVKRPLTTVFNGVVAQVRDSQISEILATPGVRAVHPNTSYQATLDDSVPLVGAPDVWQLSAPGGGPVKGAGVVVAVLDSGVDYTHKDLGGGFGHAHKVVTGYDFVNDDPDPMDDRGHGTHVAGIVAGDGAVQGVAPDASIAAYKVLDRFGQGQLSDILAALDLAVSVDNPHRADVVNLSFGGPGDGSDPLSVAASRAEAAGAVVVASAGNDGPGAQSVGSPAASPDVLAVGASASGVVVPRVRMLVPAQQDMHGVRRDFSAPAPVAPFVSDVVDIGTGEPGSYDDVDVTNKTVLISDTGNALGQAAAAEERGAAAALFYIPDFWPPQPQARQAPSEPSPNTSDGLVDAFGLIPDGRLETLVAMQIPGASASALQRGLASDSVQVEISGVDATDLLADFSSRGPTGLFNAKPDLVAPGVEVLSTAPGGGHVRMSGTSMAAPHVAGAAALLRQLHPGHSPDEIAAALSSATHPLGELSPSEQGAGRLDVAAAAQAELIPSPRAVSLGLADGAQPAIDRTTDIALRNVSDHEVTASLSVQIAGDSDIKVDVQPRQLRVQSGMSAATTLSLGGAVPAVDQDVAGWVAVDLHEDGTVDLRVPYLLAVRHLQLHVTPDPVLETSTTSVYVRSPAAAAEAPLLQVACPGTAEHNALMQSAGTSLWRAEVQVEDPGLCTARAAVPTDARHGGVTLTGTVRFEVSATVRQSPSAGHWKPIGPNGAEGQLVFDAVHQSQMAVFPWGSPSLFQTTDQLHTWRQLKTMPMAGGSLAGAVADPSRTDVIYAALNGGNADPSYQGRVLRTDDAGKSWRDLSHPDTRLSQIAVSPDGQVIAVTDSAGRIRLRAEDLGTWIELAGTRSVLQDLHWIDDDLYVTSTRGLEVVRGAASGSPSPAQVLLRPGVLGWAGEVTGDGDLLLVTAYPTPLLFASTDDGATFRQVFQATGSSFQDVALVGDDVYAINTRGVYVGHDRGATWQQWGDPNAASVKSNIATWTNPDRKHEDTFYVGASGAGIYATDEPGSFRRTGVPGSDVFGLPSPGTQPGKCS